MLKIPKTRDVENCNKLLYGKGEITPNLAQTIVNIMESSNTFVH